MHLRREQWPVLDRQQARLVGPVLEHAALPEQPADGARPVGADAGCQRDAVTAFDGRDRVELDAREPPDRGLDLLRRARARAERVPLGVDHEAP